MVDLSPSNFISADSHDNVLPRRRIGANKQFFWVMFAMEAIVVVGLLIALVHVFLPAHIPMTSAPDYEKVREAVIARLQGEVDDPLIDITPNSVARSSNVRGFTLNGRSYYYYLEGTQSFDPLSRQVVRPDQVEVLVRDQDNPEPFVIYTILSK